MDNTIWNEVNSTLDLNGPILSFSEQPTGATGIGTTVGATGGASVSFTGIATGVDPGTGYLSYQWYEQDVGKLSDSTYVTGTASTGPVGTAATLTISNLITPTDNQRKFYLVTDYVSSAYGTGRSTGNAWNEPLTSGIATVTVTPLVEVVAQPPEGAQALKNENATITVNADLTDTYFADDITYQWYLNGEVAEDGVKTVTTITNSTTAATVERTYSSYGVHQIPSSATDIEVTIAGGQGAHGGYDGGGPGGHSSAGTVGRLSLPSTDWQGENLNIYVGHRGNAGGSGNFGAYGRRGQVNPGNLADGGRGGGAGPGGWSGGGGGGGAASFIKDDDANLLVVAAGGGGGGGGSHRAGAQDAFMAPAFSALGTTSDHFLSDGTAGKDAPGDGGGGGGGGGGAPGGDGGYEGYDKWRGGGGGYGGTSRFDDTRSTLLSEWKGTNIGPGAGGDGYVNLKYTGYTVDEEIKVTNTTLSGTTSKTLTIKCDSVGIQTCQCKITSATASNSPVWTNVTNFVTTSTLDQSNVFIEEIGIGQTATLTSINLANGDYTFTTSQSDVDSGGITKYFSFYAPDRDIDIEMDLYGGQGGNMNQHAGGEGGYSRIRFTMEHNLEYVLVGLTPDIGSPFLYRKAELIACVGQGGEAGTSGRGGVAGGVNVAGEGGRGFTPGKGGFQIASGSLGSNGTFGSAYVTSSTTVYPGDNRYNFSSGVNWDRAGGQTIKCTKGVYYAQQGVGACDDIGTVQFRQPDGTIVTNTTDNITRGFKAGYNIMETAGNAFSAQLGGHGGNGATGGDGTDNNGGGGGGSGYASGYITVVDTQLGGSNGDAKVVLRVVT